MFAPIQPSSSVAVATTPAFFSSQAAKMWRGINLFGSQRFRGATTWPTTAGLNYYLNKGFNLFRFCTLPENFAGKNVAPYLDTTITNTANFTNLINLVTQITALGKVVIIDLHNSTKVGPVNYSDGGAGFNVGESGSAPTAAQYADFMISLMAPFKTNPYVWITPFNEPYDVNTPTLVATYNTILTRLRAAGVNNPVVLNGNNYTSAGAWTTTPNDGNGTNAVLMLQVTDPINNVIWDVHQYVDNAGGTVSPGVVRNVSSDILNSVTSWARQNGQRLMLGEFGAGYQTGDNGISEIGLLIDHVEANLDVWVGWTLFGALAGQDLFNTGVAPETYFLGVDPWTPDRNTTTATQDFSGTTPDDPRLAAAAKYLSRTAWSLESVLSSSGKGALLCHLPAWFNRTVSQWTDTSGNNNHFVQATGAAQPTLDNTNGGLNLTSAQSMTCSGTLVVGSPNRVSFTGSITDDVLTLTSATTNLNGTGGLAIGMVLASSGNKNVIAGTWITALLSGTWGASGSTYRLSTRYQNAIGSATLYAADGAAKYVYYVVVYVPTIYYPSGSRSIITTTSGGFSLTLPSDGYALIADAGVAGLANTNTRVRGASKSLIATRSGASGWAMTCQMDGTSEYNAAIGYSNNGLTNTGTVKLGPSVAANAFSICEVIICDITKMNTLDDQRIKGYLMKLHGIKSLQDSWIFDYLGPKS